MASSASIRRITWLLRMAKDQAGTAAGDTYAAMAKALQERHGITVELQDDTSSADDGDRFVIQVGQYEQRELWRDNVLGCIEHIYGIEWSWEIRGNVVELAFRDPQDHREHLRAAVDMFFKLEHLVEYSRFLVPPMWTMHLPHHVCVSLFRAGIANGVFKTLYDERVTRPKRMLGERNLDDLHREREALVRELEAARSITDRERLRAEIQRIQDAIDALDVEIKTRNDANDPASTALALLRHMTASADGDPEQDPVRSAIPRDQEVPDLQSQTFEAMVYRYGIQYGCALPVPTLVRARQ